MDAPERLPGMASYAPGWERTEVSRPVAVVLSVLFAAGLLAVPLYDGWHGAWRAPAQEVAATSGSVWTALRAPGPLTSRLLAANRAALAGIGKIEAAVEDGSVAVAAWRPATLDLLLRYGGAGSEEAYVGRDGWLFYRPDVDALAFPSRPAGAAAAGLAAWAADLAERGVRLVFVPLPGKAAIHPEQLARGGDFAGPLRPAALENFAADVAAAWQHEAAARGLEAKEAPLVFDPAALLWARKGGGAQFLRTDSHWTPEAMGAVAEELATVVAAAAGLTLPLSSALPGPLVTGIGDTAKMLDLPADSPLRAGETVGIAPVTADSGGPWQPDRAAPVLVAGDSYTNIFSAADLGWGESAGLAEQLSHRLGFAVDRLSRNDAGALEARRMVTAEAGRRPGWLEGKKVLVWPLAMREVAGGDWSPVAWLQASATADEFLVIEPGAPREVTATVAATGPLPPAGQTPYADYLTAVHLTGIDGTEAQAVAYVFTMKDRQLLPAEALTPGRAVRVRLSSYDERSDALDPLNRGELENVALSLETPNFAGWIVPVER